MAIWSLVLGILGVLTAVVGVGIVLGIIAIVLGAIAMSRIADPTRRLVGHGMALTGTILGGLTVVVAPVALLIIGMLLPALGAARTTARRMQNSTQQRGIHQALVTYANSNQGYFAGMNSLGEVTDATIAPRYQILLDGNYFTGEYAISPFDTAKTPWMPGAGAVTAANYSYAMPSIDEPGGRQDAWRDTLNTEEVAISDRNTGTTASPESIESGPGQPWEGSIAWNDNHVGFFKSHVQPTVYGSVSNPQDHIFEAAGPDDALQIHEGE